MTDPSPRYRVIDRFPNAKVGDEIEHMGVPGPALLPLNAAAREAKAETIEPRHYMPGCASTLPMARSLGFTGHAAAGARKFIQDFVAQETQKENT